jgi:hypothetical protein
MDMGLLFFPHPTNTADLARRIEDLDFCSIVFADTQNLAPETCCPAARGHPPGAPPRL